MAALNPDHLLDQALKLVAPPPAGPPRQVDVRRAISAAYYAVFHAVVTALADELVGVTRRTDAEYGLVYRSVDHRWLRELCDELKKATPKKKIAEYVPPGGFDSKLKAFATALIDLQEKRHSADYNPMARVRTADATLTVSTARSAIRRLKETRAAERKRFLYLLAFPPR